MYVCVCMCARTHACVCVIDSPIRVRILDDVVCILRNTNTIGE